MAERKILLYRFSGVLIGMVPFLMLMKLQIWSKSMTHVILYPGFNTLNCRQQFNLSIIQIHMHGVDLFIKTYRLCVRKDFLNRNHSLVLRLNKIINKNAM